MSGCLELKIIVRYEGLKATQYFSKYTPRSDDVFRDDLLALKLPHPKRGNTTFISHGCVECVWPLVPKNGVRWLCRNQSKALLAEYPFSDSSQAGYNQDRSA